MVTKEELFDDIEYKDILEDVREECSQHGTILNLIIPRSKDGYPVACDGSVYLEYSDLAGSRTAAAALSGKKFGNNTLVVDYVSILSNVICICLCFIWFTLSMHMFMFFSMMRLNLLTTISLLSRI